MTHRGVHRAAAIVAVAPGAADATRPSAGVVTVAARARARGFGNSYHSSVRPHGVGSPRVAAVVAVDDLHGRGAVPRSWRLKRAPTSRSYQGQSPARVGGGVDAEVAAASADVATRKRRCWRASLIGVPVVERKITAS